jgi:hypothetical protein
MYLLTKVDPARYLASTVKARSSVVEHHLDTVGVAGSNPVAPTSYILTAIRLASRAQDRFHELLDVLVKAVVLVHTFVPVNTVCW